MGIDDVVGAISVHGLNGLWGVISLGLLANGQYGAGGALPTGGFGAGWNGVPARAEMIEKYGSDGVRGLFYGDASQLWAQLLNAAVLCVFGFVMAYVWFKVSNLIVPMRVSKEVELEGLDGPELGCLGYPDFVIHGGHLDA
jgi:Amt family ammonium transporter